MDVDEQLANDSAPALPPTVPAPESSETSANGQVTTNEVVMKAEIVPLEPVPELSNLKGPNTPPEEVNFENNEFYRLTMADYEDWGASVPRIVSSPVTTAHLSSLPPISTLSVYSAIHDASTIQSSLNNSTQTYGATSRSAECTYVAETTPFLCANLKRLWHPLPAPPSSLIDATLPNPLREWHSMSLHTSVPQIRVLVDPENLAQDGVLIKWRSVGPFAKVRRFGKRVTAPIETIAPAPSETKENPEPHAPIKPLPRNAKKRLRENQATDTIDPETEPDISTKRRKEGNELYIRFPVALALSIAQNTFSSSNKSKNNLTPNGSSVPVDTSAAELLASFTS